MPVQLSLQWIQFVLQSSSIQAFVHLEYLYLSFLPTFAYASVDGGEPSGLLEQAIASLDTVRGGLPQSVSRSLYTYV